MKKNRKFALAVIVTAVVIILCAAGMKAYNHNKIVAMRDDGVKQIESLVTMSDYSVVRRDEIGKILESAERDVKSTDSQQEIDSIVKKTKSEISEIPTIKDVAEIQDQAINELMRQVNKRKYQKAERIKIDKIIGAAKKKIRATESQDEMSRIVKSAKRKIGRLKTASQYQKEAAEQARLAQQDRQKANKSAG